MKKEGSTGDLYSGKEYESFILEFEFKVLDRMNSGVKYTTWRNGNWAMGCEYQINDDLNGADHGGLHRTASLYDIYEPAGPEDLLKVGEFNQGKIVVMGNYIEHWLNGVRTVSTVIDSPEWRERVAKSKFNEEPNFGHISRSRIFFQDHDSPAVFRNISITELTPITCGGEFSEVFATEPLPSPCDEETPRETNQ